jgi:hypothetical protein
LLEGTVDWDSVLDWPLFKHLKNGLVISELGRASASKRLRESDSLPLDLQTHAIELLKMCVSAVSTAFLDRDKVQQAIATKHTTKADLQDFLLDKAAPLQALLDADRDAFDRYSSLAVLHPNARHFQRRHIATEPPPKPPVFKFEEALAVRVRCLVGGLDAPTNEAVQRAAQPQEQCAQSTPEPSEDAPLAPARRPQISVRGVRFASSSSEHAPLATARVEARINVSPTAAQAGSAAASAGGSSSAPQASTTTAAVSGSSTAAATAGSSAAAASAGPSTAGQASSTAAQTPGTQLRLQISLDLYFPTGQAARQPSGRHFF